MTIQTPLIASATSITKQAESPIHSERYYDEEGDLEILSSDNVLFKLHAYQLQASS
jgi:hypothetical protein